MIEYNSSAISAYLTDVRFRPTGLCILQAFQAQRTLLLIGQTRRLRRSRGVFGGCFGALLSQYCFAIFSIIFLCLFSMFQFALFAVSQFIFARFLRIGFSSSARLGSQFNSVVGTVTTILFKNSFAVRLIRSISLATSGSMFVCIVPRAIPRAPLLFVPLFPIGTLVLLDSHRFLLGGLF
jgi:hypothetical protein